MVFLRAVTRVFGDETMTYAFQQFYYVIAYRLRHRPVSQYCTGHYDRVHMYAKARQEDTEGILRTLQATT